MARSVLAYRQGLPFSEAVRVGTMLYLSGQIGVDGSMTIGAHAWKSSASPS
jgi:enamine deaminase RidA (YjgF/YER057c/UK114 family)